MYVAIYHILSYRCCKHGDGDRYGLGYVILELEYVSQSLVRLLIIIIIGYWLLIIDSVYFLDCVQQKRIPVLIYQSVCSDVDV